MGVQGAGAGLAHRDRDRSAQGRCDPFHQRDAVMADAYRTDGPLSILMLTYVAPLDAVDAQLKAHVAWLRTGFDDGVFLLAGRRDPRIGAVIPARGAAATVSEVAKIGSAARWDKASTCVEICVVGEQVKQ